MVTEAAPNPVAEAPVLPIEGVVPEQEAAPIQSVVAPPVTTEAPPPSVVAPPPPLITETEYLQHQLQVQAAQRAQDLQTREQQVRVQEDAQVLQAYTAQLTAQLTAQIASDLEREFSLAPEQAAQFAARQAQRQAQQQATAVLHGYNQEQAAIRQVAGYQAKVDLATQLSQQHGVPFDVLMQANNPKEMREVAGRTKAETEQATRIAQLEAQVAKLTKGSVPPQSFGTGAVGAGSAGLNEQALEKAVAAGQVAMTPEISARLRKYWNQ